MAKYDLIVIGAGSGGYVAAIRAAQLGGKVLVVEKEELGGVCLNKGCIPTKTMLNCMELAYHVKKGVRFGLEGGNVKVDYSRVRSRTSEVTERLKKGIQSLLKARDIELIKGKGKLIKGGVEVVLEGGKLQRFSADKIIVASGSRPLELPDLKFDGANILSSDDIFRLERVPKSLLIVGGGAIGCEFATIFNELGSEVTIVEMMDQLLPSEDPELARTLEISFKKRKIKILVKTKVEGLTMRPDGINVTLSNNETLLVEKTLVCVGRKANIEGIGLEDLGVKLDKGFIQVDDHMMSNVTGIYAVGDVVGGHMLAHVASSEGIVAAENVMGKDHKMDYKLVPNCIYARPQLASCGLSETGAKDAGFNVKVGKFPFQGLGRAHAIDEVEGFIKLVGDEASEELLGAAIVGPQATELIAELVIAMKCKAKLSQIAHTIHAHPTLSEGIKEAAENFYGEAIHWL